MHISQKIDIAKPPEQVWTFLADVAAVAECVPGLELRDQRDDGTYLATFTIKVGPLSAKLDGESTLTRNDDDRSATLGGKGVDKRGGSRAKGVMTYRVTGKDGGSVIDVDADFSLSGPLAQVGRTNIIDDIAQDLTRQFADNLACRLGAESSEESAPIDGQASQPQASRTHRGDEARASGTEQFDAGRALTGSIWRRIVAAVKRLFGLG